MGETEAKAQAANPAPAIRLARDFLTRKSEPLALLREAGARVDESFAGNGSYLFDAPHVAARGSALAVDTRPTDVAPETLLIVLPPETRLTLASMAATLGTPARMPGLPGKPWQYTISAPEGRYGIVLDGDPAKDARVLSVTAIRER